MIIANAMVSFLSVATASAELARAVAVGPCVVGPGVSSETGNAVTTFLITAGSRAAGVRILDRSATQAVLREQDICLMSQASSLLSTHFAGLGADQVVLSGLFKTPAGMLVNIRCIDVAKGDLVKSVAYQARRESDVLQQCEVWAGAFWAELTEPQTPAKDLPTADPALTDLWQELDSARSRKLLGRHLDRAESVFRQYMKAVENRSATEAARLRSSTATYFVDCLSVLQRAEQPPKGMVYIPPGRVTITIPGGATRRFELNGFFIDRCEFTRGQYAEFLRSAGRPKPLAWSEPTNDTTNLPVTGVDWYDAEAAAAWRGLHLPTQAQWLLAGTGGQERLYPWGNTWRDGMCAFARTASGQGPKPVGSFPDGTSPQGALDMAGNVGEWLDTWYSKDYWRTAPVLNPPGPAEGAAKLVAGGSYRTGAEGCQCASIEPLAPKTRKDDLGFRCVLVLKIE